MNNSTNDHFDDFSVFELAKMRQCTSLFKIALENLAIYKLNINSQDDDGNTLLHLVIGHQGQYSTIEHLMALNPDVNIVNYSQETPLYLACQEKNLKLVKLLVEKGAQVHFKDAKLKSLLHLAVEKNNLELCKFLIDRGMDLNSQDHNGSTPLHYAVEQKFPKMTFFLVHKADVNRQDYDGYTPLHTAARTSSDLVKFLLRNKASSLKTFNGDLPLHLAASSGNLEAVIALLKGANNVNSLNNDNYSPLKLAEINGHEEVQRLLARNSGGASCGPPSKIPKSARSRKPHGSVNTRDGFLNKMKVYPEFSV